MIKPILGIAMLVAGASGASAQNQDAAAQAQAACMNDVMRLCPEHMLDPDAARACMKTKKDLVSPECAAFYPGGKRAGQVR